MSTRLTGVAVLSAALLAIVPAATAAAAEAPFGAGTEFGVGSPSSVVAADFNGDGRQDFAATASIAGYVSVRLGKAGGGFTTAPRVDGASSATQVAVADFNGDGNEDLAVSDWSAKKVRVQLGKGDGTFTQAADITVPRYTGPLVVGDFNGDAWDDLVIQNRSFADGGQLSVRLGAGNGTFTASPDVAIDAFALAVGEFHSDGREDLVVGTGTTPPAAVLTGAGTGGFTKGVDIGLPGSAASIHAWTVGDLDEDGKQDLAAAVYDKDVVTVRKGNGNGTFATGPDVPVGDTPAAVAIADVNADGHQDLLAANYNSDTVSVRLGDGTGAFRDGGEVPVGQHPQDLALADFDGDGTNDLAVANLGGDSVTVHLGRGGAPLEGNLLVNGGFEGATATGVFDQQPEVPGWSRRGAITYLRYGMRSHAYTPPRVDSARFAGGSSLLWGGNSAATNGITEVFQTVDVSAAAGSVDGGKAIAGLSAWLGGGLAFNDLMSARAEFLSGAGDTLKSIEIGPVTPAERNYLTTLVRRAGSAPVPPGTRRIRVTVTSDDDDNSYSSAFADNIKLTLDAPPQPTEQSAAAFGPATRVTLRLAGRDRVRVTNGNPFAVTGSLGARHRRVKLRAARLRVSAGSSAVVRLRLPASLRRALKRQRRLALRLTALVHDPAGNTRTVRSRAGLRFHDNRRTK